MTAPTASNTLPGDVNPIATNSCRFSRALQRPLASLAFAALALLASPAWGQFVSLGTAEPFAILGSSTVTNTGSSVITGDLGVSPGLAIIGFPPGTVIGTSYSGGGVASGARTDATTAYNTLAGRPTLVDLSGTDLGGLTLTPGVYAFTGSAQLTGTLTLDAQGDPNAVFIFKIGTTLTTAGNSLVLMTNSGQDCNVFWQVGSSATLGTTSNLIGSVIANASVTATTGARASGRLIALNGAVTMDGNSVTLCSLLPPVPGPVLPPTLSKDFNQSTIDAGGISRLTVTLGNSAATTATLTAPLVDNLPSGVVIAATPNVATTCGGSGTPLAVAGGSTLTLPAGRSIPPGLTCSVSVDVTAALAGHYINVLPAGSLVTNNGSNPASQVAILNVVATIPPPTLAKAFSPSTINAGGISTLTIILSNPNVAIATLTAPLTDTLPSGVVIAPTPNANTTCGGAGAPVAVAGSSTVTLPAGRTIPSNGSCTLTVDVTAAAGGSYINTLVPGSLVTSNGNNPGSPSATLTVVAPSVVPFLGKAFSPASINAGGVSTLTVTLSNANAAVATLTSALVDTLPSGVVVAPTPNVGTTCTGAGAPVAAAGGTTVTLPAGRSIPANGSCTLTVDVTAAIGGTYVNTLAAGALVTSNGNNPAPAVATLTVVSPVLLPGISKTFTPSTINAGGVSTLTVTLRNPDPTVATLTSALIDNLPSGVRIAPTPNVNTTCTGTGAPIAVAGATTVTLPAGRSIPANGSCTLTVSVTAAVGGSYINTILTGALMTSNGNNPGPAIATLTVIPQVVPPGPGPGGPIPTLSEWAMILLAGLMAIAGFAAMRRREQR